MRFRRLIVCSILLALLPAVPAQAEDPPSDKLEAGLAVDTGLVRAIVEVATPVPVEDPDVQVVLQPPAQPFMVVEASADSLDELADDPRVLSIRRDRAYPPSLVSSVKVIGADRAHAAGTAGAGQAVAILDTGIDRDHPFFGGRIVAEACFSAVDQGVQSLCPNGQGTQIGAGAADAETPACQHDGVNLCEHGTHVAGIAAGNGGVAPGANIIAVQVFSRVDDPETCGEPSCLLAFESSLLLAMDHVAALAAAQPIAALNLSLGGQPSATSCDDSEEGRSLKPKIDDLLAKGVPTVVAAGNEQEEGASFPACLSSAVAVGATDDADAIADFSNRGPLLDLFAPGVDVESSVPDDQTAVHSGTSMAAPHVAGSLALLKSAFPGTSGADLVEKLKAKGRPVTYQAGGAQVSTPRVDVYAALTDAPQQPPAAEPGPAPEPAPESTPTDQPTQQHTPIPLPTVTVTVTVTVAPPAAPASVCTRGTASNALTTAQWAVEITRGKGEIPDETLNCYLKLVQKASKVFPEVTKASSLGRAYRVLKASAGDRARLDGALLAAWLNWASGAYDSASAFAGTSTFKATVGAAEKARLSPKSTSAQLRKWRTKVG